MIKLGDENKDAFGVFKDLRRRTQDINFFRIMEKLQWSTQSKERVLCKCSGMGFEEASPGLKNQNARVA